MLKYARTLPRSLSSFIRQKKGLGTQKLEPTKELISVKFIQRLQDIDLCTFLKCQFHQEYDLLVLSGDPTFNEKQEAWNDIQLLYADKAGGSIFVAYYKTLHKLIDLRTQRESIVFVRDVLMSVYSPDFAAELNNLCDTDYDFNPEDWDNYIQEIKDACSCLRIINVDIKLTELEFEDTGSEENLPKVTEDWYYDRLVDFVDVAKLSGSLTDKISMYEFCRRLKQLEAINKKNKEQSHGSE